ncbi:MAG TPA: MBL fold metallo-hydrolase [Conexibacter sp.]|nr:MBL fold metallo-hydrolase [Conexibacter sp.]
MRRVTWHGHATVLIETGDGARLLTDPILRGRVAHLRRHAPLPDRSQLGAVDGVLVSHVHHDHLDRPTLKALAGSATTIVLPPGAGRLVRGMGFGDVRELTAGAHTGVGGSDVRAVPAWHTASRRPRGRALEALGFVVDGIWFVGDSELNPRMEELRGQVDVALMPIWGWGPSLGPGHLDPAQAAEAIALVQPRIAIPIHWGTYLPYGLAWRHGHLLRAPALEFAAHVARVAPDVRVETLKPGGSLEL